MSFQDANSASTDVPQGTLIISTMRVDVNLLRSLSNSELSVSGSDSPFFMFMYHRDRILRAAHELRWPSAMETVSGVEGARRLNDTLLLHFQEQGCDLFSLPKPFRVRLVPLA